MNSRSECAGAKQAAEKARNLREILEEHPAGSEANSFIIIVLRPG
jgi:hypothetical protein